MTDQTPDEAPSLRDFYAACDGQHREFFSSMLHEWQEAGLPWEWREGGIVLCVHSAGKTLRLLFLRAESGSVPPSLTFDLAPVRIRLGDAEADSLLKRMREVREMEGQVRQDICRVPAPGNASVAGKQGMKTVLRRLSMHLPNVLAP